MPLQEFLSEKPDSFQSIRFFSKYKIVFLASSLQILASQCRCCVVLALCTHRDVWFPCWQNTSVKKMLGCRGPSRSSSSPQIFVLTQEKNVLGGALELCCTDPLTGFHRDGFCRVSAMDGGVHAVCAQVNQAVLIKSSRDGSFLNCLFLSAKDVPRGAGQPALQSLFWGTAFALLILILSWESNRRAGEVSKADVSYYVVGLNNGFQVRF